MKQKRTCQHCEYPMSNSNDGFWIFSNSAFIHKRCFINLHKKCKKDYLERCKVLMNLGTFKLRDCKSIESKRRIRKTIKYFKEVVKVLK